MPSDRPTVAEVIGRRAQARGEHPFLICDADQLSYAEAERRSALLARGLIALGAGKGTHVGLLYPNGSAFVVGMLAAARIGAVVVPFTTFATARELGEQLAAADVFILLATPSYRSHDYVQRCREVLGVETFGAPERLFVSAAAQLRYVIFDQAEVAGLADTVDDALFRAMADDVDGSDPLAIIYTSGSTGTPKGAVLTHSSVLVHQQNLNTVRGLSEADRLFCNSPFFWVGGFGFALLATLMAGSTLVCSTAVDAADTLDLIEAQRPTVTNGFASAITYLARHASFNRRDLDTMRRGNLYPIMAADCRPADPELRHNMLGMTEAGGTFLLSGDEGDQPEERRGSYGAPAPGFETAIVDGELRIRGPFLMQRYYRRGREESFDADGWFHTGDLVAIDVDGFIHFIGRRDSMIKTAGANVSPAEVERAISKVTGGKIAHVVGLPDDERGEVVAAAVVIDSGETFDVDGLRTALSGELSAYKMPRRVVAISDAEIPLLSSGKVDVRGLRKVFNG